MRPQTIDRLALRIALLLAGATLLAAWITNRAHRDRPQPPDARALFDRHCAACHERSELLDTLRAAPRDEAALVEFLAAHGRSNAADDRRIAGELLSEARR